MGLVKCPDCEKMISNRVKECPNCGCPSDFFINIGNKEELRQENLVEGDVIEFVFGENIIKYPANSEKYAALYGDYVKLGIQSFERLCVIYRQLGDIDVVVQELSGRAQSLVDEQINKILGDLYNQGVSITINQFKEKYSYLPINYEQFIYPLKYKYNEICGIQEDMALKRQVDYENRGRWIGGGFGMKGAIQGAINAGILNVGSSIISGIGNSINESLDESIIERKKRALYLDENLMIEICEGIVDCMNALFIAYTNELSTIGKLGNKIIIDFEAANAKYENALKFEKDEHKLYSIIIECLSLYPSNKEFYNAVEMQLNECETWKLFKNFWHLGFLYTEDEEAIMKTKVKCDDNEGTLKITRYALMFEGTDTKNNKLIKIDEIKNIDNFSDNVFYLKLTTQFLLVGYKTEYSKLWVNTIKNVMAGNYKKVSINDLIEFEEKEKKRKEVIKRKIPELKVYIMNTFDLSVKSGKREAIDFYVKETGEQVYDATKIINDLVTVAASKTLRKYFCGQIDGLQCLEELGEQGTGMIASSMFAAIGKFAVKGSTQAVLGGLVGGMVGYALASASYKILIDSLNHAKLSHEERENTEKACKEHIKLIREYRAQIEFISNNYLIDSMNAFNESFSGIKNALAIDDIDWFIDSTNEIIEQFGGKKAFSNMNEFDSMMLSGESFKM